MDPTIHPMVISIGHRASAGDRLPVKNIVLWDDR